MKITYRKLDAADSKRYREIRLESLKVHPESFGSTYEEQRQLPKLKFESLLEQPVDASFMVGAFDQGTLIGICGFLPFIPSDEHGFQYAGVIIQVYVKSSYSGRKIGPNLVKAVIDEAFKLADIEQIILEVAEGNTSAIRVYEQAGFRTYKIVGGEAMDGGVVTRVMVIRRNT
jgi:ribosomal protein S18 acetylase RimI-like enzyme